MSRRRALAVLLAGLAGGPAGCGRKGDLELPPREVAPAEDAERQH